MASAFISVLSPSTPGRLEAAAPSLISTATLHSPTQTQAEMFQPSTIASLQCHKRSARGEAFSTNGKKVRTLGDSAANDDVARMFPSEEMFSAVPGNPREEHVVGYCAEIDDVKGVAGEVDVETSEDTEQSGFGTDNSVSEANSLEARSESTNSSISADSLTEPLPRETNAMNPFQRKRRRLLVDVHLSSSHGLSWGEDTVWDEDVYKSEVSRR